MRCFPAASRRVGNPYSKELRRPLSTGRAAVNEGRCVPPAGHARLQFASLSGRIIASHPPSIGMSLLHPHLVGVASKIHVEPSLGDSVTGWKKTRGDSEMVPPATPRRRRLRQRRGIGREPGFFQFPGSVCIPSNCPQGTRGTRSGSQRRKGSGLRPKPTLPPKAQLYGNHCPSRRQIRHPDKHEKRDQEANRM